MKKSIPLILTCGFAAFVTSVSAANVAKIGDIYYEAFNDAISAASQLSTPAIITLVDDVDLTEVIQVTADLTLDLNGHTITNNVTQNRAFRLSGVTFTIDGNGGSIIIPETNTASYGFVDFRDMSGTASPAASLKVSDTTFKGGTDEGSLFAFRADGQAISLDNVNVELTPSHTYSIVNGYQKQVDIDVNGGEFVCNSTHTTAGVFQAGAGSTIDFTGAKVTTSVGPLFEVIASTANFTDCDFTNTATNSYFASCVSVSNGGTANINGGTYSANYPVYVYNSGGTINVKDGTFDGKIAAIKADNADNASFPSNVTVENGTFNGALQVDNRSELSVSGGNFSADVSGYCADGASSTPAVDNEGNTVYVVLPADSPTVALIGTTGYRSLNEAFAAATAGQTISLCKDADLTEVIPVTADLTLDLNGHTITNNVTQNRAFRLSGVTFTIDGNGGSIITPETNTASYGFVDFRDMSGTASPAASLKVSDTTFKGGTDEGSLFAFRADGQAISLDNVNVELTPSHTYSIVNGYQKQVDIDVNGGEFVCNSTHTTAGVFQAGAGSTIDFTGAKVTTSVGPLFEVIASTANFTDCDFTNTATNSYFASCVSVSNGGTANINGGTYSANYPVYVYNSGGTINVKDGTFDGKIAAIKADNSVYENSPSKVTVENGTFNGDLQIGDKSELSLSGGTYTDPSAAEYCADGFTLETNADGTYGVVENTTPSGIETVVTDSQVTSGAVYNLHGVKVADTFEGLPAGLYILNGHKVILNH